MTAVILLGLFLGLGGIVWVIGDLKSWSMSAASRRILGAILSSAWAVLLATYYLTGAVNNSVHSSRYDESLRSVGLVLPMLAWLSLIVGVLLLCDRKASKPSEVPKPDEPSPTEPS